MASRQEIANQVAEELGRTDLRALRAVLGFDGFVDDILRVVETRQSADEWRPMASMEMLGKGILAAAGKSANFEVVRRQQKIGGNGPIMANALANLGLSVTYIGAVGNGKEEERGVSNIHPVFEDFAVRARLIPLSPPAHTSALEFQDGKVMLGNLRPLLEITWERLMQCVGREELIERFSRAALIGLLNWTMLPGLTEIWRGVAREILPALGLHPTMPGRRRIFVDLADPQKRLAVELADAMAALRELESYAAVTLGLNFSEAQQLGRASGVAMAPAKETEVEALVDWAVDLRDAVGVETVVIHPRHGAAAASGHGALTQTSHFHGPFVEKPVISTGAGDHFNAGFALGQLLGMELELALCLGTALSGFYVRRAASPTTEELAAFLRKLP